MSRIPLYVDLDGTLITSNLLWEGLASLLRQKPLKLLIAPIWLMTGGHPRLRRELATHARIDFAGLPYRRAVIGFLRTQQNNGRTIILTTTADERLAAEGKIHLKLFDGIVPCLPGADPEGRKKLQALTQRSPDGFGYLGDWRADASIWRVAKESYVVADSNRVQDVEADLNVVCPPDGSRWRGMIKLLRPHQWVKNLLVFLPLFCAHQVHEGRKLLFAGAAFVCLSCCASSVYVLNDLLDLSDNRHHATKRRRPLASGAAPLSWAFALFPLLLLAALLGTILFLDLRTFGWLALYWGCSAAYSLHLKRLLLVDVFVLAGLYTLRILVGGSATLITVSPWLLALSVFLFVSLAFAKRYAELRLIRGHEHQSIRGRGYQVDDLAIIESVGPTSGYMAVLVLSLYINSETASRLYHFPTALWMLCPLLMYWLTRIWFFARRGWLDVDPVL